MIRGSRSSFPGVAVGLAVGLLAAGAPGIMSAGQSHTSRQRARKASICGNPTVACNTTATFKPNDLPFRLPPNSVIFDTELFYAIVLKSVPADEGDATSLFRKQSGLKHRICFRIVKYSRLAVLILRTCSIQT